MNTCYLKEKYPVIIRILHAFIPCAQEVIQLKGTQKLWIQKIPDSWLNCLQPLNNSLECATLLASISVPLAMAQE
jgi:hypothetical protein